MRFLILIIWGLNICFASDISFEVGRTDTIFNRFAIPNDLPNRVSLPIDETITSYRATGFFDLPSGNKLYVLYAPLETSYEFSSKKNFEFNNTNFSNSQNTTVSYKFSSYRLGYMFHRDYSSLSVWGGLTGKIRDAEISVKQKGQKSSFDNVGFVPLLSFGLDWTIYETFSLYTHTDALGASQGAAYDSQVELRYKLNSTYISFGKRILGGGADNDNVYNFAQFDSYFIKVGYNY
jgi:hypothetical protein